MHRAKQIIVSFFILSAVIGFSWAFFSPEFFRVHDYTHVARIVEMRTALDAGHFPVHWTQNFGYGYGMPLYLFYGPLVFYAAAGLTYLGFSALMAMKLMYFFSGVVAFAGMYTLMRRYSHTAGLISATLFFTAPYRAVDLFVRGALNEVWAIAFLPWLVYGGLKILKNPKAGVAITAISTSAIILTHNLTALLSLPLLGVLTIAWQSAEKRAFAWKKSLLFILGGLLGTIMSAFYILPAFIEKQFTIIDSILSGYFDYRHHFLYIRQLIKPSWGYGGSEPGPNDGISFQLGLMTLFLLLLGLLFFLRNLQQALQETKKKHILQERIWGILKNFSSRQYVLFVSTILLLISLFMTLFHSQAIWETVPLLNYIQFPWRFLGVAIVFSSIIGGIAVSMVRITPVRWMSGWLIFLLIVLTTWGYHRPENFLTDANQHYYTDTATIRKNMSDILPDYLPAGFDRTLPPVGENERIIVGTEADDQLELSLPQKVLWLGEAPENTLVTWNIAHFPGWKYSINDQEIQPELTETGIMQVTHPEKITSVGAEFLMTPIRQQATWISVAGILLWLALALPWNLKGRRAKS